MNIGLEHVAAFIKEKGLPSTEHMRAELEEQELAELRSALEAKAHEYNALFGRFKAGKLNDEETKRMMSLSDEFRKLSGD